MIVWMKAYMNSFQTDTVVDATMQIPEKRDSHSTPVGRTAQNGMSVPLISEYVFRLTGICTIG